MAINDFTQEQKDAIASFWPYAEQFVRKVHDVPGMMFTGFVYGGTDKNPILIHVGNIDDNGDDLVTIHYSLARMAATMDAAGLVERSIIKSAPDGSSPEEIADKLALALLATPLNEDMESVQDLLKDYLTARAPKKS